jgi:large subunit ribosomal protein L21
MQYRVEPGQTIDIALCDAESDSEITLNEVLAVGGEGTTRVGAPLVDGAYIRARVVDSVKGKKIVVFRYRNKKRYRRRTGHRQQYTRIEINEIVA